MLLNLHLYLFALICVCISVQRSVKSTVQGYATHMTLGMQIMADLNGKISQFVKPYNVHDVFRYSTHVTFGPT